jgi:hypothetical protein
VVGIHQAQRLRRDAVIRNCDGPVVRSDLLASMLVDPA